MARTEAQNVSLHSALTSTIKQMPSASGMSHDEMQRAATAGLDSFRLGNFEEAAQRGIETVRFGTPITPAGTK